MSRNILIISMAMALFAACGDSKTESKTEAKRETLESKPTVANDSSSEKNPEQKTETNKLNYLDLVGTWEQTKTQQLGTDIVTGTISVKLMANGDFVASATTTSKMGKPQNSPTQTGKWTLYGNTVSLSGMRKLEYHENTQTLVDASADVELKRQ